MICPFCKHSILRVTETRDNSETSTRRRRECEKCHKRFTTYERIEKVLLNVKKRDGRVEEFNIESSFVSSIMNTSANVYFSLVFGGIKKYLQAVVLII